MNPKRIIASVLCVASALAQNTLAQNTLAQNTLAQGVVQKDNASRERALLLWEEAIQAKGGRERLQSVQNLLISSTVDVRVGSRDHVTEAERLFVMPGKAWVYTYTPDFDVSVDAIVINTDRNFCMLTLSPPRGGAPLFSWCFPTTPIQILILEPVIYLMETTWVRPMPVVARTEGKGKKQIDVIETYIGKLRVDFYLDRKTRLPFKMVTVSYGGIGQGMGPPGTITVELEDYVSVDGILMPQRVTRITEIDNWPVGELSPRDTERARYRFNVSYNEAIFDGPAPRKVKRHDWKTRRDG